MAYLKITFFTLFAGYLCGILVKKLLAGVRTGAVSYVDSRRQFSRATEPVRYWMLMGLFAVLLLAVIASWFWAVLRG